MVSVSKENRDENKVRTKSVREQNVHTQPQLTRSFLTAEGLALLLPALACTFSIPGPRTPSRLWYSIHRFRLLLFAILTDSEDGWRAGVRPTKGAKEGEKGIVALHLAPSPNSRSVLCFASRDDRARALKSTRRACPTRVLGCSNNKDLDNDNAEPLRFFSLWLLNDSTTDDSMATPRRRLAFGGSSGSAISLPA